MQYDYTMDEVMRVAVRAEQLALSMPAGFSTCPLATLRAVYNGIGPDRWSARLRRVVTELLEWFAPEALIHDWEYTFQPKTYWRLLSPICASHGTPVSPPTAAAQDFRGNSAAPDADCFWRRFASCSAGAATATPSRRR